MSTQYHCGTQGRRSAVASSSALNGIDYVEVSPDQTSLWVSFLHELPGGRGSTPVPNDPLRALSREQVTIEGGVRVPGIQVLSAVSQGQVLKITVSEPGDFSTYTLRLARSRTDTAAPEGFDPQLSVVPFSFKVECPSDFDCLPEDECPSVVVSEPEINYLAKDYASFRRLMLDRLSTVMPDWQERNPADVQVALVELLAYVGDHLSYYQDAVSSEAYLRTSRLRTSVRRHARMLDYFIHDGTNARAWVCFKLRVGAPPIAVSPRTPLLTRDPMGTTVVDPDAITLRRLIADEKPEVFETLEGKTLRESHNGIPFYTWSDGDCCLPRGATRATLVNTPSLELKQGDVLVFEEVVSPTTGRPEDADISHRHAVRLTATIPVKDPLSAASLLEVEWEPADALPFPLRISATTPDGSTLTDVSVARGNVVLADHGRTISGERLDRVPGRGRFRPRLQSRPLTRQTIVRDEGAEPLRFDPKRPATEAVSGDPRSARESITLQPSSDPVNGDPWKPRRDLLASDRFARDFVVETETDGASYLRFGDGVHGRRLASGTELVATCRVGNGAAGNIGAEALGRIAHTSPWFERVWNPLPATGGTDPESLEQVRLFAPQAFRSQERAVTEADYTELAQRHSEVQKAAATLRWTGSWYTAYVTVDREGGRPVRSDPVFRSSLEAHLERYRVAGYDLEINGPLYVPLDILITVCVQPGYFRSDVKQSLLRTFSARAEPSGARGYFHPDNFTFGQPVYLSQIYAAATAVAGVAWVELGRFQRWGKISNQELQNGVLAVGPLEIVRLENSQDFPEHGRMELVMKGGL